MDQQTVRLAIHEGTLFFFDFDATEKSHGVPICCKKNPWFPKFHEIRYETHVLPCFGNEGLGSKSKLAYLEGYERGPVWGAPLYLPKNPRSLGACGFFLSLTSPDILPNNQMWRSVGLKSFSCNEKSYSWYIITWWCFHDCHVRSHLIHPKYGKNMGRWSVFQQDPRDVGSPWRLRLWRKRWQKAYLETMALGRVNRWSSRERHVLKSQSGAPKIAFSWFITSVISYRFW